MTLYLQHVREDSRDEMIYDNGRNKVIFSFYKDRGTHGWSFEIYKGKEYLAGFNVVGNRIVGPYNNVSKRIEVSGFNECDSPNGRYCYVENDRGVTNTALFVAEGSPFKCITFCDSQGGRAIDMNFDEDGRISSISRSPLASDKEGIIIAFDNANDSNAHRKIKLEKNQVYEIGETTTNSNMPLTLIDRSKVGHE